MARILILSCMLLFHYLGAAEGLSVSFRTHSMFDEAARLKHFYGPAINKDGKHWNGTGTMCAVVWLETKNGMLVKTIGRWANNSGYSGNGPQGDFAGRAYDLVMWNGVRRLRRNAIAIAYDKKISADPRGGLPPAGETSPNCYDNIMGPTIGAPVNGRPQKKHGDLISTTENGKKPWDFIDRNGEKVEPGTYRLCIECVEWSEPFDGTAKFGQYSVKGVGAQYDYVKIFDVEYDGFSFRFPEQDNIPPYMGPEMVNPTTQKIEKSKPVIYDIAVVYTPPMDVSMFDEQELKKLSKVRSYIDKLSSEKSSRRKSAAKRLANYGALAQIALPQLEACLNDENKYVVKEAQKAIEKIKNALADQGS